MGKKSKDPQTIIDGNDHRAFAGQHLAVVRACSAVNFAATGKPNGGSLARWPAYSAKEDQILEFGDHVALRSEINKAGLDFFDTYYQSVRPNIGTQ